ncbi:hypothetical protein [Chitinophaga vietnamensis]|uniref:hypothetical protein n=1 Tax=Chitinophaga vietnamensis TaxID=2593957 RepID=UPI0011781BD8|nr:hypothetical protein [Chitinophaga vietnamensis]
MSVGSSTLPQGTLDVNRATINTLSTVLGRLPEGNAASPGTYLGLQAYNTTPAGSLSFAFEHKFYGVLNSAINFYRGSAKDDGFMTFTTATGNERMRISANGNIGIGTTTPAAFLDIGKPANNTLTAVLARMLEGSPNTYLGVQTYATTPVNSVSFALEHKFYGVLNSAINFYRGYSTSGGFIAFSTGDGTERMRIDPFGNVCIGTPNPQAKLSVNGDVFAKRIKVTQTGWPDYVFTSAYQLPSLQQVEHYIHTNGHLPEMPTAEEVEAKGQDVGEMNKLLLKKVEELTLYIIEQNKRIEALEKKGK